MILEKINKPNDIKKINPSEYATLAGEIRKFLIESVSKTGGHLASNLGVVELTMALHLAFDLPKDKIIWDVGHQSYTHKLLTGRKGGFNRLRKFGGMSGFPKREESDYDAFNTGHSSTSISAGVGYATARDLEGKTYKVVSVIGDGALTGGMAFEAFNNASGVKGNFIIVLNDNDMSIAPNVGGISDVLTEFRTSAKYYDFKERVVKDLKNLPHGPEIARRLKRTKDRLRHRLLPGQIIESFGVTYVGPIDGHDVNKMIRAFHYASKINGPVVVHVLTKKGKGYSHAEKFPSSFHGVAPFDIKTGEKLKGASVPSYAAVFSEKICAMAKENSKIVGITAAMPDGVGLKRFSKEFPDRYFDVGIAEGHAVTFAAGLAAGGMIPVFGVYSSFLQRGYDQIVHDVCMQNLKVIFAIDHAGLVGSDGETHQGIFDLSFLSSIPGLTIIAPKNGKELEDALEYAVYKAKGPVALRYPSGAASKKFEEFNALVKEGESEIIHMEKDIALLAAGRMMEIANIVREQMKDEGFNVSLINARFIKPFDKKLIRSLAGDHKLLVTMEENVLTGGFGEHVCRYVSESETGIKVLPIALPDAFIEHGSVKILFGESGIDPESVKKRIISEYNNLS